MKLLDGLNIRFKIMLPMFMIMLLLLITFFSSFYRLNQMKKAGERISGYYAESMSLLGDISTDVESLQKLAYSHCTATDVKMKQSVEKDIDTVYQRLVECCNSYEMVLSANNGDMTLYNNYKTKFDAFLETFNTVIICSSSYQYTTAQGLANVELKTQANEVNDMVYQMREANKADMQAAVKNNAIIFSGAIAISVVILVKY